MPARARELLAFVASVCAAGCVDDPGVQADASETGSDTLASESTASESSGTSDSSTDTSNQSETNSETGELPDSIERMVEVTLDGEPIEGATVIQGGANQGVSTDAEGRALAIIDTTITGDLGLMASHPLARTKGQFVLVDDPSGRDRIKVLDFGLAKSLVADDTETTQCVRHGRIQPLKSHQCVGGDWRHGEKLVNGGQLVNLVLHYK